MSTVVVVTSRIFITGAPKAALRDLRDVLDFDYTVQEMRSGEMVRTRTRYAVVEATERGVVVPYGALPEVLHLFRDATYGFDTCWSEPDPRIIPATFSGRDRESQERVLRDLYEAHRAQTYGTCLIAPCGAGKTRMGIRIIGELRRRTLIIVHTKELLDQWRDRITEAMPGVAVGTIADGKCCGDEPIVIALIQSLVKFLPTVSRAFSVVIADECFPPSVQVNGVSIKNVSEGDVVAAADHSTGRVVFRRVLRVMQKHTSRLYRVRLCDGSSIDCTGSHPFYTDSSEYIRADSLSAGDQIVRSISHENIEECHAPVHDLRSSGNVQWAQGPRAGQDGSRVLLRGTQEGIQTPSLLTDSNTNQPEVCVGAHDETQPHAPCRDEGEGERNAARDRTQTSGTRRERKRANRTAEDACGGDWARHGSYRKDWVGCEGARTAPSLQARPGMSSYSVGSGDRRGITRPTGTPIAGQKEGDILVYVRVDCVEVLERGGNGEFERVCPDGIVYNIEVEGEHNYFANGCLVHNCHHTPAQTFASAMNSLTATVKIGLTASTKRRDGLHPLIFATVGPIISSVAQTDLIDEGNVMPVHVEQLFTGFTSRWNAKTDYTRMMTDLVKNRSRNDLLVNRLVELVDAGRHVLVLSARTEHLATLHGLLTLKRTGVGQVLTGKTPTKERKLAMARMVEGFPVTFATTQLAKEGLDAPILDALVYATPNRDDVTTQQSVGRIQRVLAGKPTPLVIDPVDNIGVLQHQASERMRVYRKVSGGAIL